MNQTKYYRADQLEFSFLQEMDSEYYSDRSNSLIDDSELGLYHQIFEDIKNNSNLMKLNMENPWD